MSRAIEAQRSGMLCINEKFSEEREFLGDRTGYIEKKRVLACYFVTLQCICTPVRGRNDTDGLKPSQDVPL